MDILKTFELFNKESMGILKDRIVRFFLIETQNASSVSDFCMYSHIKKNKEVQISVVNNAKAYNLLTAAWHRQKKKIENENIKC